MHKYRAEAYLRRFSLTPLTQESLEDDDLLDSAVHALDPQFDIDQWQGKSVNDFLAKHCPLPFVEKVTPLV